MRVSEFRTVVKILIKRPLLLCSVQSFLLFAVCYRNLALCTQRLLALGVSSKDGVWFDVDKTRQMLSASESEGVSLFRQSSAQRLAYTTFPTLQVRSPAGRKKAGRWNGLSALQPLVQCVMRRRTGTSAPSALPVRLMAAKHFLSTNRKSTFLSLFLSHQWRIFKSLAVDPKCNTFMSVVMMLK